MHDPHQAPTDNDELSQALDNDELSWDDLLDPFLQVDVDDDSRYHSDFEPLPFG